MENSKRIKICGIYKIRNIITGYCYIGSSVNCNLRWLHHNGNLRKGIHVTIHLQRAWNKYGAEKFEFIIIEQCALENKLIREQWYLDNTEKLYNSSKKATPGPRIPRTTWTQERREKQRNLMLGNTNLRGKKASEETKKLLSLKFKGRKLKRSAEWEEN